MPVLSFCTDVMDYYKCGTACLPVCGWCALYNAHNQPIIIIGAASLHSYKLIAYSVKFCSNYFPPFYLALGCYSRLKHCIGRLRRCRLCVLMVICILWVATGQGIVSRSTMHANEVYACAAHYICRSRAIITEHVPQVRYVDDTLPRKKIYCCSINLMLAGGQKRIETS